MPDYNQYIYSYLSLINVRLGRETNINGKYFLISVKEPRTPTPRTTIMKNTKTLPLCCNKDYQIVWLGDNQVMVQYRSNIRPKGGGRYPPPPGIKSGNGSVWVRYIDVIMVHGGRVRGSCGQILWDIFPIFIWSPLIILLVFFSLFYSTGDSNDKYLACLGVSYLLLGFYGGGVCVGGVGVLG